MTSYMVQEILNAGGITVIESTVLLFLDVPSVWTSVTLILYSR